MRTATKWLMALSVIGAAALSVPGAASAQGIYFGVPGFGVGVGAPWYGHRYYYDEPYGYYGYGRPYGPSWRYRHHGYRW
jgi:hypothetical protein